MQTNTRIERVEVKRCFVAGEKGKERLQGKTGNAFQTILAEIEKEVLDMSEFELDCAITWPPRLRKYNELVWHFEECSIDDIGVWYGAGGLPADWCIGSVQDTAECVLKGLKEIARISKYGRDKRAVNNLPAILEVVDIILNNRLLAPIVVPGGTWRPSPPCRKMKGDIDDGSLRAVAFAVKGYEKFNAYVGKTS